MALFSPKDRPVAEAIAELTFCNPFTPARMEHERRALGDGWVETPLVWSLHPGPGAESERPNVERIDTLADSLITGARAKLATGADATPEELGLYQDLVLYRLYQDCRDDFYNLLSTAIAGESTSRRVRSWKKFRADFAHHFDLDGRDWPATYDPVHLFACCFQIRRAFYRIFNGIVGGSLPAARLRAAVWQSIFTRDLRRYARVLYRHMGDMTTLITGPSGTGKELVARAIGQSRYVPFDPEAERFEADFSKTYFPLNLSALSETLIESELFGHKRGSFTGAVSDRTGWLEICPPHGTVFLDEIGDLDPTVQVKLLRVIQTRTFQRLGETTDRTFTGKIVAATNRDLAERMQDHQLREDFYYRLCSDIVTTSSLREQLADCPDDLHELVRFITAQFVDEEAEQVTDEVIAWIDANLGRDYAWPGNFRELEQCVCNVLISGQYTPVRAHARDEQSALAASLRDGAMTLDELTSRYCAMVYERTGSYEKAAKALDVDRRTVKAKVTAGSAASPGAPRTS